ncbi:cytidylyltransferase domain-containing protein [Marinimicrobium sp. ABcell2]|uniref:acylneuraminate cytidylyltransferase family protein n=1 Tax=Marinimicrobium sp. ABcell2 TaxID=3069751 RepID=UPI0027B7E3C0|nr:acylneuraminate cytidylyltransferase family protein [Marinimicrobium sp. ABcell2]MDQ2078328.1 acylneuraminate cytidylyltransferase family protein [Marinimicrobium sp. ABcell2]
MKVFLPCRKGSERVPRKNIKPFAGYPHGLLELKLRQLIQAERIDEVILSTNDEDILEYARTLGSEKLTIHHRADSLCTSATSTDELMAHVVDLIPEGHILWTHVTSPFVNATCYDQMIKCYFEQLDHGYDSLMSSTLIRSFLWNDGGPINYDRAVEKWPRTQTLPAVHEVNSAAFINSAENYRRYADRIGQKPFLFSLESIVAHDIDWEPDFVLAESIAQTGLVEL